MTIPELGSKGPPRDTHSIVIGMQTKCLDGKHPLVFVGEGQGNDPKVSA